MTGLVFPPQVDSNGTMVLSSADELPLQSIRQILSVRLGEVCFAPVYGSDLGLFESGEEGVSTVKAAIDNWLEPDYWAMVTPSFSDPEMIREDVVEWAATNISVIPLPP